MKKIKNYSLRLMNREKAIGITSEESSQILRALIEGEKYIQINDSIYATHQIISIERCSKREELDLLESKGLLPPSRDFDGLPSLLSDKDEQKRKDILKKFEEKLNIRGFPQLSKEGGRYAPELLE